MFFFLLNLLWLCVDVAVFLFLNYFHYPTLLNLLFLYLVNCECEDFFNVWNEIIIYMRRSMSLSYCQDFFYFIIYTGKSSHSLSNYIGFVLAGTGGSLVVWYLLKISMIKPLCVCFSPYQKKTQIWSVYTCLHSILRVAPN